MASVCEAWEFRDPVSRAFRIGAARGADAALLSGARAPTQPMTARWEMGRGKPGDVVWSTAGDVVLLSRRTREALFRAGGGGWKAWPVTLIGKHGEAFEGYSALSVTGRAGPADHSRAHVVWRAFPGGRYPYLKGCWFSEQSWDGSAVFMERPHQGEVQTCGLYVSDRAAAALRSARITNVALERLTEREVSAMIFGEAARARWPEELRGRIAAERDPS